MSESEIHHQAAAGPRFETSRLDVPHYEDKPMPVEWSPVLGGLRPTPAAEEAECVVAIACCLDEAMGCLSERELRILNGRYLEGLTLEELGAREQPAITRERVRQIEKQAIENVRALRHKAAESLRNWMATGERGVRRLSTRLTPLAQVRRACFLAADLSGWRDLRVEVSGSGDLLAFRGGLLAELTQTLRVFADSHGYAAPDEIAAITGLAVDAVRSYAAIRTEDAFIVADGRIGFGFWNKVRRMHAVARELALAGFRTFHASQLLKAAREAFPDTFASQGPRDAIALMTQPHAKRFFEFAGRKGTYQVVGFGDGHDSNVEAINAVFREHRCSLHDDDIWLLLDRDLHQTTVTGCLRSNPSLFDNVAPGIFLARGCEPHALPEVDWLRTVLAPGETRPLGELATLAREGGLVPERLRGLAATSSGLQYIRGNAYGPSRIRRLCG